MANTLLAGVGAITIGLIFFCVRSPKSGLAIVTLIFLAAPLYPMEKFEYVFYGFAIISASILLGWWLRCLAGSSPFKVPTRREPLSIAFKLWLLLCAISLPLSTALNSGSIPNRLYFFVKGVLPFLFLSVFFIVRALPLEMRDVRRVLRALLIVGIGFGIISCVIYFWTRARVTWAYEPLIFPFTVLGANIAFMYFLNARGRFRNLCWAAIAAFLLISVLLSFTKAQIISALLGLILVTLIIARDSPKRVAGKTLAFGLAMLLCFVAFLLIMPHDQRSDFYDLLQSRLSDSGTADTRLGEWRNAYLQFIQSPIVGKGIGFQLERTEFEETISAGYVHNQLVYVAMTTGLAGLTVYLFVMLRWVSLVRQVKNATAEARHLLCAAHACILSLVVYALLFASFRTIQHNYLFGLLLGLVVSLTPPKEPAAASQR